MKACIVFLPGLGMKEPIFDFQLYALKESYEIKIIVLDKQKTLSEMADAVLSAAPRSFYLAGHSMGGWVAQQVAASAPERVQKLILISTTAKFSSKTQSDFKLALQAISLGQMEAALLQHAKDVVHPNKLSDIDFMLRLKELQMMQPPAVYTQQINAMLNDPDIMVNLPKIKSPTLLIHGREDRIFSLEEQQSMHKAIAGSKLTIIENCGHLTPLEQKEALAALVRLWCQ